MTDQPSCLDAIESHVDRLAIIVVELRAVVSSIDEKLTRLGVLVDRVEVVGSTAR